MSYLSALSFLYPLLVSRSRPFLILIHTRRVCSVLGANTEKIRLSDNQSVSDSSFRFSLPLRVFPVSHISAGKNNESSRFAFVTFTSIYSQTYILVRKRSSISFEMRVGVFEEELTHSFHPKRIVVFPASKCSALVQEYLFLNSSGFHVEHLLTALRVFWSHFCVLNSVVVKGEVMCYVTDLISGHY